MTEWDFPQVPPEKEVGVGEFTRSKQEIGDRATYAHSRLMASYFPRGDTYSIAKEAMGTHGPSFAKGVVPLQSEFSRVIGKRNYRETIEWGRMIPIGDCAAQEATIGEFHIVSIVFGDTIRASERIRGETHNVENRE